MVAKVKLPRQENGYLDEAVRQLAKRILARLVGDGYLAPVLFDDGLVSAEIEGAIEDEIKSWVSSSVSD